MRLSRESKALVDVFASTNGPGVLANICVPVEGTVPFTISSILYLRIMDLNKAFPQKRSIQEGTCRPHLESADQMRAGTSIQSMAAKALKDGRPPKAKALNDVG